MSVDKVVAKPGETLTYRVYVANLGDQAAEALEIESHFPSQTTEAPTAGCPVDADPCVHVDVPSPGLGEAGHQVQFRRVPPLEPNQTVTLLFRVRINEDAVIGSHVRNHGHASALGQPRVTSASVDTLVVGAVPNAMFGGSKFAASGHFVTDSYESEAGPYASTHADARGDIASNGDIVVSGGSIINGNATPGPGHVATISNNATVTGTATPSPSVMAMNEIDTLPYRTANDNGRLCGTAGSCTNTVYDEVDEVLTVEGAAAVDAGVYYLCALDVRGTLSLAGPVTIVIGPASACAGRGTATFSSGARVEIDSGAPRDLLLLVQGDGSFPASVSIGGRSVFTGVIYAAQSQVGIDGGSHLFGLVTAGGIVSGTGGAFSHQDRSLDH